MPTVAKCSKGTKAKYIKIRIAQQQDYMKKAMTHTQHSEENENVSRAMHTEYKTGKQ